MLKRYPVICSVIALLCTFIANISYAQTEAYGIMHFTPEQLAAVIKRQKSLPLVEGVSAQIVYPDKVDLYNFLPKITSLHHQERCGNCWVWAGISAAELAYSKQFSKPITFSVQYLNSNYNLGGRDIGGGFACDGGDASVFVDFYEENMKFIPWGNTNAEFADGDGGKYCLESLSSKCSNIEAEEISTSSTIPITSISTATINTVNVSQEQAIANIKAELVAGRGVYLGLLLDSWDDFKSFWIKKSEEDLYDFSSHIGKNWGKDAGGHALLIIGYDSSSSNPDDHYWLVLNSWGVSEKRPRGLLRLKMNVNYSATLNNPEEGDTIVMLFFNQLLFSMDQVTNPSENPDLTTFVQGSVLNANGKGVSNVKVSLNRQKQQITDSTGKFLFKNLPYNSTNKLTFLKNNFQFDNPEVTYKAVNPEYNLTIKVTSSIYDKCRKKPIQWKNVYNTGRKLGLISSQLIKIIKSDEKTASAAEELEQNFAKQNQRWEQNITNFPNYAYTCPEKLRCKQVNLRNRIRKSKSLFNKLLPLIKKEKVFIAKRIPKKAKVAAKRLKSAQNYAQKIIKIYNKMPKTTANCD